MIETRDERISIADDLAHVAAEDVDHQAQIARVLNYS